MEFDPQLAENLENFGNQKQSCSYWLKQFIDVNNCCRSIVDLPPALISDILEFLEPKELGILCCVSTLLNRLASENRVWKEAYCERWGIPGGLVAKSWKELYVEREFRSRTFLGRYKVETLHGHTKAVKVVCLLASAKLIFTSGYDSVVRMWNAEGGYLIGSSRPLNCTIRAIAADTKLLVAGGTSGFIQGWYVIDGMPDLSDLTVTAGSGAGFRLWEHEGPISSLAVDSAKIYSGSWDMTVRIWDRASLQCIQLLMHNDWVWSIVHHVTMVATSSGPDVYIWSTVTGTLLSVINNAHTGHAYALAGSQTGNFLFSGGEDGTIQMFEKVSNGETIDYSKMAAWNSHSGPVYSLAFEFPWLVSASSDGKLSLIDIRKLLKCHKRWSRKAKSLITDLPESVVEVPQRMLHGFSPNLYSVGIGADRIICGGEEGVVRIWDFSESLEAEQRAAALRALRLQTRLQRKKLQLETATKPADYCSVAAQLDSVQTSRNGLDQSKRGTSGKLRA